MIRLTRIEASRSFKSIIEHMIDLLFYPTFRFYYIIIIILIGGASKWRLEARYVFAKSRN